MSLSGPERVPAALRRWPNEGLSPSKHARGNFSTNRTRTASGGDGARHSLDLHWHLSSRPLHRHSFSIATPEELLERSAMMDLGGIVGPSLGATDLLIHTAVQWSGGDRLNWFLDLDHVIANLPIDCDDVVRTATNWGVGPLVADALGQCIRALASSVPKAEVETLPTGAWGHAVRLADHRVIQRLPRGGDIALLLRKEMRSRSSTGARHAVGRVRVGVAQWIRPTALLKESPRESSRDCYLAFVATEAANGFRADSSHLR